jgi:8-oxo-dGTP pyrophosphatase MutT (NUDIX family)
VTLEHDGQAPMRCFERGEPTGRAGRFTLRYDLCEWPDGTRGHHAVIDGPSAALIVPLFEDGTTVLVRQWRYAWAKTSWEAPAGTIEDGEDPLEAARRELAEEAGLEAEQWTALGQVRPYATGTVVQHLFLARGLTRVERQLESYERDLIVRELPLSGALDAALRGEIEHAGSTAALLRAARAVGVV